MYMYMIIYMLQCHIIYYVCYPMYIYDMVHHQPPRPLTGLQYLRSEAHPHLGFHVGQLLPTAFSGPK